MNKSQIKLLQDIVTEIENMKIKIKEIEDSIKKLKGGCENK